MLIEHNQYDFIFRKASYPLWLKYGINKFELKMLGEIAWFFAWSKRMAASKEVILKELSGNNREKTKMMGYCEGLERGQFLCRYVYVSNPGSKCIGLTVLGVKVLKEFNESIAVLSARYMGDPAWVNSLLIQSDKYLPVETE